MWEKLILGILISLIVAVVLGLIKLAYAHSVLYRVISYPLLALVVIVFIGLMAWAGGVHVTYESLKNYVDTSRAQPTLAELDVYRMSFLRISIVFVVVTTFLLILRKLRSSIDWLRDYSERQQ